MRKHWDRVYTAKAPGTVSWYQPHLARSLELIARAAPDTSAAIIDVGGGESTLVDDLLSRGYGDVTVLDISETAIKVAKRRLGARAQEVTWLAADIAEATLAEHRYDVWHDRAVFHFLTEVRQRLAYVRQVKRAMKPQGHVIVATFAPEGPTQCSGLEVVRYDADALHDEFGPQFRLVEHATELHHTPSGTAQQFLYCLCKVE